MPPKAYNPAVDVTAERQICAPLGVLRKVLGVVGDKQGEDEDGNADEINLLVR